MIELRVEIPCNCSGRLQTSPAYTRDAKQSWVGSGLYLTRRLPAVSEGNNRAERWTSPHPSDFGMLRFKEEIRKPSPKSGPLEDPTCQITDIGAGRGRDSELWLPGMRTAMQVSAVGCSYWADVC